MVDLLLGLILGIIAYAIVIWIVGKLGLGMEVSGLHRILDTLTKLHKTHSKSRSSLRRFIS